MAFPRALLAVLALEAAIAHARMQRLAADEAAVADGASAAVADGASAAQATTSILVAPSGKVSQRLTICNAYPSQEAMSVLQLNPKAAPTPLGGPMAYMSCQQLALSMSDGLELEFRQGNTPVGEFTASDVPRQATSLLLVASRKRAGFTAVAFDSHAFSDADLAQVAVIDAYRGPGEEEHMKISRSGPTDPADAKTALVQQDLEVGSIAYLNPGAYTVQSGMQQTSLVADKGKTYVLMRVGTGAPFPEQLVLYSGTPAARALAGLLFAFLAQLLVGR